ncbi:MAG: hypothetical protein LBS91_01650 [Clostridiales Family XIII bacterium]|jgi:hypothetical protein|nr:hypothetical protein [Clostridiales Family XIII bacterium]
MNYTNAYLQVEEWLNEYYDIDKPYDLGSMLSDMCTRIWKPKKEGDIISGDPAIFASAWTKAWDCIVGNGSEGTSEQVFKVAKTLLDYYTNEVKYDLGDAENYLREKLSLPVTPKTLAG